MAAPVSRRAIAGAASVPRCHASSTVGARSIQSATTSGPPVDEDDGDGVPVAAIAWMRFSWSPGSRRSLRELASPASAEGSPTATGTTLESAAARAAACCSAASTPKNEAPGRTVNSTSGRSARSASASEPADSANDCTQAPRWSVLSAYGPTRSTCNGPSASGSVPSFFSSTAERSAAVRAASRAAWIGAVISAAGST